MREVPLDFVLRSRRVVVGDAVRPAAVHVANGVIAAVSAFDEVPSDAALVDVGDRVVSPGVVDSHVHVNEPGRTEWEGFTTATRAAARGGVTTLVDMPLNSIPPTTNVPALDAKRAAAEGHVWVDVGFWGGAVPGNDEELTKLLDAGALGFKCFMVESGVEEFPCVGEVDLRRALEALAGTGAPLLAHAELPGPIDAAHAALIGLDPCRYETYMRSRPREAEDQAIALLVDLCRATGARVHVVHLSSSSALEILRRARAEALPFTVETTPHYLHFAAEDVPDGATAFKCAPPIRERENRETLWKGLSEGVIDLVVSDHSPCTPDLKKLEAGDFVAAWGGIASLQLGLSIVWTEASRRGASLADIARWLSKGPAELAGLWSRKGSIAKGKDADLVVWDPDATFTVEHARVEHRNKITPYAGERLRGVVEQTFVRGRSVYEKGIFAPAPTGRLLAREKA